MSNVLIKSANITFLHLSYSALSSPILCFSLIYSKGAVKSLKPNPEIHYKILNELEVKPEECLIVEDSLIGIEAAINAGIDFVVIYDKYSDGNRDKINELAKIKFENFSEMINSIKNEL